MASRFFSAYYILNIGLLASYVAVREHFQRLGFIDSQYSRLKSPAEFKHWEMQVGLAAAAVFVFKVSRAEVAPPCSDRLPCNAPPWRHLPT